MRALGRFVPLKDETIAIDFMPHDPLMSVLGVVGVLPVGWGKVFPLDNALLPNRLHNAFLLQTMDMTNRRPWGVMGLLRQEPIGRRWCHAINAGAGGQISSSAAHRLFQISALTDRGDERVGHGYALPTCCVSWTAMG